MPKMLSSSKHITSGGPRRTHKLCSGLLARLGVEAAPVDGHFFKKIVLFFVCCLLNFSLEQTLWQILDALFSNSAKILFVYF